MDQNPELGSHSNEMARTTRSLSKTLTLAVVAATCVILVITIWFSYTQSRNVLEQQSNAEALKQVQSTADQFDAYLDRVAVLPRAITARKEATGSEAASSDAASGIVPFLARLLDSLPPEEAFGVYLAKAGDTTGPDAMPWVDRNSFPKALKPRAGPRDRSKEWYAGAERSRQMYISEPYFDAGGSEAEIVSVTLPFYTADGKFGGVAGADLSLDLIRAIVTSLRFRPEKQSNAKEGSGTQDYSFLITRSGRIMAHPNEALSMSQNFAGADVRSVPGGNDIAAQDSGFSRLLENGLARRVYWAKAPLTGWKVAMSIPEMEITGSASQLAIRTVMVAGLAVFLLVLVVW